MGMYRIVSFGNLGADDTPQLLAQEASASGGGVAATWVSGGILVGLAVLMFAVDTKDPLKLKTAR